MSWMSSLPESIASIGGAGALGYFVGKKLKFQERWENDETDSFVFAGYCILCLVIAAAGAVGIGIAGAEFTNNPGVGALTGLCYLGSLIVGSRKEDCS